MFQFLRGHEYRYNPLHGGSRFRSDYSPRTLLLAALVLLASTITSFYAGRLSIPNSRQSTINCKIH